MKQPLADRGVTPGRWGPCREKQTLVAGGAGTLSQVQVQQALLWAGPVAPVHWGETQERGHR